MKRNAFVLFALLLMGCVGCAGESAPVFTVLIPKIGAADCSLLSLDGKCAVIDVGEEDDGPEITEKIGALGVAAIDAVIITHYDKDHIGALPAVLAAFEVKTLYEADYEGSGKAYKAYASARDQAAVRATRIAPGGEPVSFTLGGSSVTLYPPLSPKEGDNDNSLAAVVEYGQMRLLFAGDAEDARMEELIRQIPAGPYALVKMPHHGRAHTKTEAFLAHVRPLNAVITCSDKNPPAEETLAALKAVNAKVYETRNGDLTITTHGNALLIRQA